MSAPSVGLRERKKVATRQALHEAAVRLAVEHGLDRLTVEAIADAADVSRRTFSNYFANKEEALLWSDRVRMGHFRELVGRRPKEVPAWQAMSAAALQLVEGDAHDPRWIAQVGCCAGTRACSPRRSRSMRRPSAPSPNSSPPGWHPATTS